MIRPITTLIAAGLLAAGSAAIAKDDAQKTNADLELEMAIEFRDRLADPNSEDARELRRRREAVQDAQSGKK